MARPIGFAEGSSYAHSMCVAREATGVIAADNASLTDANIPLAGAIDCSGYDTIFVGVEIVAGSSPTMTVEPLFRDTDGPDGFRWRRRLVGAPPGITVAGSLASQSTGALAPGGGLVELRVDGSPAVFLRTSAVANATSTTSWKILVSPGAVRARPRRA